MVDAKAFFETAHQLDPEDASTLVRMMRLKLDFCDWSIYEDTKNVERVLGNAVAKGDQFTPFLFSDNPTLLKRRAVAAAKRMTKVAPTVVRFERDSAENRKIRIGYFSNDFFHHATMQLLRRVLELHDRDKFEIFVYDYTATHDPDLTEFVKKNSDQYLSVKDKTDFEVAEIARADKIDAALDLKGYTTGGRMRIFANRAAPVQVSYLGYPGTTGLKAIDYFLADPLTIPAEARKHMSEKILYMPQCYQPNDNTRPLPKKKFTRAQLGLPEDAIVFGSFNNPNKVGPEEFDVWMKLLKAVPDSVLWFLADREEIQVNIKQEAEKRGVGADRVIFAPRCATEDHFERITLVDIFLDTFACNAHTTASETLWAGVPVVTKTGQQFAARVATSIVHAIGCPELACDSKEAYFELALKLATDREALAAIKQKLSDNVFATPLYDSEQYTRDFEALLTKAVRHYDAGKKPEHMGL
nr:UDP-N-acetylglucosamine-peptide N-acetylglucosaminyltransferase [Phaeobacter sp.]